MPPDSHGCRSQAKRDAPKNLLGGTLDEIACGVSLGIGETPPALVKKVEEELRSGYQRIKLKIKPGKDLDFVAVVRKEFPAMRLSVDANSAYQLEDTAHLKKLDQFDLLMMEESLPWDKLDPRFDTASANRLSTAVIHGLRSWVDPVLDLPSAGEVLEVIRESMTRL